MTQHSTRRGPGRVLAGILASALTVPVLFAGGSVQAATVTVAAMNYAFMPASRTIAVGDVVRWTFAGDPHSVTSRDGLFDSGVTDPGGSFQFRFVTAGTYRYYCQVHPEQMFGTIVVKAAATPKPTVRSTPAPTSTPRPTVRPTVKPTPTPEVSAPPPSAESLPPSAESLPPSPETSETAGASIAQLETPLPGSLPASPAPGAPAPTSSVDAATLVGLVVILGAVVIGGLFVARGRRGS